MGYLDPALNSPVLKWQLSIHINMEPHQTIMFIYKKSEFSSLELIIQKKMCLLQRHLKFICDVALQESVFHF